MAAHIKKIILVFQVVLMFVAVATAETDSYDSNTDTVVTMEELSSQMKELQEEINRLREETDVRNKLEATLDEQTREEKEILTAAGQDYALSRQGFLEVTYGFYYSYNSTDILESTEPVVDHSSNHNLTNSMYLKYAFKNNLTLSTTVPFIYKSDQRSTSNERNATDIGDLSFGCLWQPTKSDGRSPTIMYNASLVIPSGTSPYKIDADEALSTGSGFYSLAVGSSISKSLDPVFVFGSASIYYPLDASGLSQRRPGPDSNVLTKVSPGQSLGLTLGMAYALSYTVSLNTSISYTYSTKYTYYWEGGSRSTSGASTAAVLNVGTGWRISPKRTVSTSLGIGLTNSASDFTFSFSIPFDFKL